LQHKIGFLALLAAKKRNSAEDTLCPGHDNKLLDFQIYTKTCNNKELKKMSKLETIARVAVGIVVIGTLWPIGLFGDD